MSVRALVDAGGVEWRVWATHAGAVNGATASLQRDAWLTFDSTDARRRLSPILDDWATASLALLEEYLNSAEPVPIHLGHSAKTRLNRT
jgi:hypothetical protein